MYDHMRVHVEATLLAPEPVHSQLCHPSYEKCDYSKQLVTNLQPSFEFRRIISNNEELQWTDGEVPNHGGAGCARTGLNSYEYNTLVQ